MHGANTCSLLMGRSWFWPCTLASLFFEVGLLGTRKTGHALSKIISDFAGGSGLAYFFIGYWIALWRNLLSSAESAGPIRTATRCG